MKITQISVFLENRPGRLSALAHSLATAGVNLSTLMLSDNGEFGLLRLLTPDVEKAKTTIAAAGYASTTTEVVALEVPDRPGCLATVLAAVEKAGVSVEYMYAFAERPGTAAIMVFRFDDMDKALAALRAAGVGICQAVKLFER